MKNLLAPASPDPAETAGLQDGIIGQRFRHFKAIGYPNRLRDIAVMGRLGDWHRSFLVRPRYGGTYAFLLYPEHHLSLDTLILQTFALPHFNSPPMLLDIVVPEPLRAYRSWKWRVVRIEGAGSGEDAFLQMDDLHLADGFLSAPEATSRTRHALESGEIATLVHETRPVITGEVVFDEARMEPTVKTVVWSCHQPYENRNGKAAVKEESRKILRWYRNLLDGFSPHRVWMLGDSVYSDGITPLDFVAQVYNRRGWEEDPECRDELLGLYRLNYRFHWSFADMQAVMCRYPHLGMWDDHEIRDGFGSESDDFRKCNQAIKQIASRAAEEYLFQYSPKLRGERLRNRSTDKHQAHVDHVVAAFVFDGRNSRNYGDDLPVPPEIPILAGLVAGAVIGFSGGVLLAVLGGIAGLAATAKITEEAVALYRHHNPGEVISDLQLADFTQFCHHLKGAPHVKYLLLGNSVPFIYLMDLVETLVAESAIAATDLGKRIRDDSRDSWHSPANRRQLARLIEILRDLHRARPDLEIINLSGDIHTSNAFRFQPEGFSKPLFQVTTSAITNDPPHEKFLQTLMADGIFDHHPGSRLFGPIDQLWSECHHQNFLTIEADANAIRFRLRVFDSNAATSKAADRVLTIMPDRGFSVGTMETAD